MSKENTTPDTSQEEITENALEEQTETAPESEEIVVEEGNEEVSELTSEAETEVSDIVSEENSDDEEDDGDEGNGEEEEEESELTFEDLIDTGESTAMAVLSEILDDISNLPELVEKSDASELALLMEAIAQQGDVGEYVPKVGSIKKKFDELSAEGDVETAVISRFSTALARFNRKRKVYYEEREKEKEENSRIKFELLEELKKIVTEEQVTKINEVREIQEKWRNIGWVLQKDIEPLNATYHQYLDIFYNLRGKYQDLLDYDRKYNLEQKQKIVEEIEALIPEEELEREKWNELSQKVKELKEKWHTIGHVPRESVKEAADSLKNALDRFFEMRNSYFEVQDKAKEENSEKKKVILAKLQKYSEFVSDKAKNWNTATREVLALQEEWKKTGPAPFDVNKDLWKTYRELCDLFFENKGKFFKDFDVLRNENLKQKIEICEKAEALMESDDWNETTKKLKELQREWKKIGPVHERHSNKVWKRFRKACDNFFDRKAEASGSEKNEQTSNLKLKEELIAQLTKLAEGEHPGKKTEEFKAIQAKWKETGHVPYKEKDKINNAFKDAIDLFFKNSDLDKAEVQRLRLEASVNSIKDSGQRKSKINSEIFTLKKKISAIESTVSQYEINIQYISKGKSGEPLRKQIQGQIDQEKKKIVDLKAKIKQLQLLEKAPLPDSAEDSGHGEEE